MYNQVRLLTLPTFLSSRPMLEEYSVYHSYDHLSTIFVPSIGLKSTKAHTGPLPKFTQQILNDNPQTLSLLTTERTPNEKGCPPEKDGHYFYIRRRHRCRYPSGMLCLYVMSVLRLHLR